MCHDDGMRMPLWLVLLVTLLLLMLGGVLMIAAAWMRGGSSRAARWWVVRRLVDSRWAVTSELFALVLLPLIAQTLLVAGLIVPTVALLAGLGVPSGITNGLMIVAAVVEVVIWLVVTLPTAHEAIFPMYIYPRWLRAQRAADKDRFMAEARQKRERRQQRRS